MDKVVPGRAQPELVADSGAPLGFHSTNISRNIVVAPEQAFSRMNYNPTDLGGRMPVRSVQAVSLGCSLRLSDPDQASICVNPD